MVELPATLPRPVEAMVGYWDCFSAPGDHEANHECFAAGQSSTGPLDSPLASWSWTLKEIHRG